MKFKCIKITQANFEGKGVQTLYEFGLVEENDKSTGSLFTAGDIKILSRVPDFYVVDMEYCFSLIEPVHKDNIKVVTAVKQEDRDA
jgi:hypothetical protein